MSDAPAGSRPDAQAAHREPRASNRARSPITVLFVDHAAGMGGAEHSLLALLEHLDRSRVHPTLAAVPGPLADAARAAGVAVHVLPLPQLKGHATALWRLARGTLGLAAVIRRVRADVVHANVLRAAVYAAPAAALCHRPLVWHVRDILARDATTVRLCRAAAVVAISHAVARELPCADRARVVYNPVAVRPPRPRSRGDLGLPAEGTIVASIGRLRAWKGHAAFLDAAARVRNADARFVVVGGRLFGEDAADLDLLDRLRARAADLGIGERVTWLGHRDDVADLWPHVSLLVHTAVAEPFGRVAAEALVAGVPVVAFGDGGIPEIVDDGVSGVLAAPGDVAGVAAAVDRLLGDPGLRARMGSTGQAIAQARFDPTAHARAIEAVYDCLT